MERQYVSTQFNEQLAKIQIQLLELVKTIDDIKIDAYTLEKLADNRRRALERHRLEWEKKNYGPSCYNSNAEDEID